jgi:uncharacterized membrane protein
MSDQPQPSSANQNQDSVDTTASNNREKTVTRSAPDNDNWMRAYWRPAMGFTYMVICIFDFILFPMLSMVQPLFMKLLGMNMTYVVWQSLTLQNGGFFHIAMGAVLGVAAWTRGQEKLAKTK